MKRFKRFKLKKGKEVLNSTGGNCIAGHSILMTLVGMLSNTRTDLADSGYSGIKEIHSNSQIPTKASKKKTFIQNR